MFKKVNEIHDFIIDFGIATEKEVSLVTSINGYNEDSLNNIIYSRTSYPGWDTIGNQTNTWKFKGE